MRYASAPVHLRVLGARPRDGPRDRVDSAVSLVRLSMAFATIVAAHTPVAAQSASDRPVGEPAAELTGKIVGRLHERVLPLNGALVEVRTSSFRVVAETDSTGRYSFRDLRPGRVVLRASYPGHETVSVRVQTSGSGVVRVDLELEAAPLSVEGVAVEGARGARATPSASSPHTVDPDRAGYDPEVEVGVLEISPSIGASAIADAVQALPGNDPANPSDVLFMRGNSSDLKLVLLDGVPVFTPFHVAGLIRSFEPSVLDEATLHVGGAPARFDGGLTHILDLRTRSARRDRFRATGSLDLLSASAAAEVPLGRRAGAIVSTRTLHDLGSEPLGSEGPYGYADALLSVQVDPATGHRLRATGFSNGESVRLNFNGPGGDAEWHNRAGSISYRAPIGDAEVSLTGGASRYDAQLPLQPSAPGGGVGGRELLASARQDHARMVGEIQWGSPSHPLRAGVSVERIDAWLSARALDESVRTDSRGRSNAIGLYAEATRPVTSGLTVRAGLRADAYSGDGPRLSPRATIFWELGSDAMVSIAAGRYHQVTRTPDSRLDETLTAFADRPTGPGELLPVATSDHLVLGLDQRVGDGTIVGIQGFWKRFEGLVGAERESIRNSGLDLRVLADRPAGAVWIGYGLSWFWSARDLSGQPTDFAGRHILSAGASSSLAGPFHGEVRLAYGAGLPTTSVPFGSASDAVAAPSSPPGLERLSPPEAEPPILPSLDESFLRLDLEVHAVVERDWGGRPWRIRPYLKLMNALDRRDALFYLFQRWRPDSVTPLAERPVIPVVGIAFAF